MSAKRANRRRFLETLGATGVSSLAIGFFPLPGRQSSKAHAAVPAEGSNQRANKSAKLRRDVAEENRRLTPPNLAHLSNADDEIYPDKIASYSKGLPHNSDGTVVLSAYAALVNALNTGRPEHFDAVPMGGDRKLTNPQARI